MDASERNNQETQIATQMMAYLNGDMTSEQAVAFEQEVAASQTLRESLNESRMLLATLAARDTSPSQSVFSRVVAAFRHQRDRQSGQAESAEVAFDSWAGMSTGMRGAARERQLLFSSSDVEIDVQLVQGVVPGATALHGQLFALTSADIHGIEIVLAVADGAPRRTLTDAYGQFQFADVAPTTQTLSVRWHNKDIDVTVDT